MHVQAILRRWIWAGWGAAMLISAGGCSTTSLMLGAMGVATDTSIPWAVTKHLYAKITEGDPVLCMNLNSVQRALTARCGPFDPGSLQIEEVANPELQECPLTVAARDPQFWPVLPELIQKGALLATCYRPPLVALAQGGTCPDFNAANPEERQALAWLATSDPRSIQHDVIRLLSCPQARQAQFDRVIDRWRDEGKLAHDRIGFGVLGALHPDHLDSQFSRQLEASGHTAQASMGGYERKLPSGFEEALRTSHWQALDWWFDRMPELVNKVPASSGGQLAWVPLARVLVPTFLANADEDGRREMVRFLMSRGATPWQRLPFNPGMTVLAYATSMQSPLIDLLATPANTPPATRHFLARRALALPAR